MSAGPWSRKDDGIEPTLVLIAVATLLLAIIGLIQLATSPPRSSLPPVVVRPVTANPPADGRSPRLPAALPSGPEFPEGAADRPSELLEPVADPLPPGRPLNARDPDDDEVDPNPAHH